MLNFKIRTNPLFCIITRRQLTKYKRVKAHSHLLNCSIDITAAIDSLPFRVLLSMVCSAIHTSSIIFIWASNSFSRSGFPLWFVVLTIASFKKLCVFDSHVLSLSCTAATTRRIKCSIRTKKTPKWKQQNSIHFIHLMSSHKQVAKKELEKHWLKKQP